MGNTDIKKDKKNKKAIGLVDKTKNGQKEEINEEADIQNIEETENNDNITDDKTSLSSQNAPPSNAFIKFCFFFYGISSLLAWNAILTVMDFFETFQHKYNPSVVYPFCNNIFNMVLQLIILAKKGKLFEYKKQLMISLLASIVCVILIPIPICCTEKDSLLGFILTCIIILFLGFVNALLSNGFFGLASLFPTENLIFFSTGQGIAGILMNLLQVIILACSGASTKTQSTESNNLSILNLLDSSIRILEEDENDIAKKRNAIIFFAISALIILICFILMLVVYKTQYYTYYLDKAENKTIIQGAENLAENHAKLASSDFSDVKSLEDNGSKNLEQIEIKNQEEEKEKVKSYSFCEITKRILSMDILAAYVYIITISLFPGACLKLKLFDLGDYYTVTINIIYNVTDTLGRLLVGKIKPTKILSFIMVLTRTVFFILLPLDYAMTSKLGVSEIGTSIFTLILLILLGSTNGIGATLVLGLAPTLVPQFLKGPAGSSIGFFNIVGIFTGSCLAFLVNYIISLL